MTKLLIFLFLVSISTFANSDIKFVGIIDPSTLQLEFKEKRWLSAAHKKVTLNWESDGKEFSHLYQAGVNLRFGLTRYFEREVLDARNQNEFDAFLILLNGDTNRAEDPFALFKIEKDQFFTLHEDGESFSLVVDPNFMNITFKRHGVVARGMKNLAVLVNNVEIGRIKGKSLGISGRSPLINWLTQTFSPGVEESYGRALTNLMEDGGGYKENARIFVHYFSNGSFLIVPFEKGGNNPFLIL